MSLSVMSQASWSRESKTSTLCTDGYTDHFSDAKLLEMSLKRGTAGLTMI